MSVKRSAFVCLSLLSLLGSTWSRVAATDWTHWRGPYQNGVAPDRGLISSWSLDGENLIWRADFVGRSTPILLDGRVYVVGRTGTGVDMQRVVACYDAKDGKLIWERKTNVFHTTVPFSRVGWSSLAGDPETGYVYLFGVDGLFVCYDRDGHVVWEHSTVEEYNRFSGYGGRTATPIVDEDLVITSMNYHTWGDMMMPRHRFLAFDKRTGELVWTASTDAAPKNTNYSVPVVTVIDGIRTLIAGGADGVVYAFKVRTGEKLWKFQLTRGAVQTSVVVDGNRVYACHGRENLDNEIIGRVVCIDATGRGDITTTHEVWRHDGLEVGYASPLIHDGRLYVVTNDGDLFALDARTGRTLWQFNLGKVGKGSPVWADGKILATEVNGSFHILEPGEKQARALDSKQIRLDDKRYAEIFGSPAVAYGRIYFTTEVGLYCLGDPQAKFEVSHNSVGALIEPPPDRNAAVAHIQIVPAETWIHAGERVRFKIRAYDDKGRSLGVRPADSFVLQRLSGRIDGGGTFTADARAGNQGGYVVAKMGDLETKARVLIAAALPFEEGFEAYELDQNIPLWPGAWKFFVKEVEGNKVLVKPPSRRNLNRHNLYLGPPDMRNYTIQADLKAEKVKRRSPDMGLIANRYYFDFMTKKKRLQIRTWPAELERLSAEAPFEWNPDLWYTMKLRLDLEGGQAVIKGKIWPRDEPEPEAWTLTAVDPHPNLHGSPALYGDAVTHIYYDNVKITRSESR